jgi:Zn-finger nucleic acid-binding protein
MKCPRDESSLEREIFCGVEIDTCPKCQGNWLDEGEMSKVLGMMEDMLGGEPVAMKELTDRQPGQHLPCPLCADAPMDPYFFSYQGKIVIDRCPRCQGIWLDGGELKQAIRIAYGEFGMV